MRSMVNPCWSIRDLRVRASNRGHELERELSVSLKTGGDILLRNCGGDNAPSL